MNELPQTAVPAGRPEAESLAAVRARQQGAIAALGVRALGGLGLPVLRQEAAETVARVFDTELVKVVELLPDGSAARVVAGVGWREGVVGRATVTVGPDSQAGYALLTRQPVVVDDLATETRLGDPPLLRDHGVVSGMSVILYGAAGRAYGVLGAHTARRRRFTTDDVAFLQGVANVLSAATQRAHAEEQLRRAHAEAEAFAAQLQEQAAELEQQTEEARALAEELEQANAQLHLALLQADEGRARALASEQRYRALVEASTLMVWSADAEGQVDDMPFWRELTGQARAAVQGSGWTAAIHPDDQARVAETWRRATETRSLYEAEYRLRLCDGTYRWFRARGAPVLGADGAVREWVGVFDDVDDARRAEVARTLLEHASEALAATLTVSDALAAVARIAVTPVGDLEPFADGVTIDLPRVGGGFTRAAIDCRDPARTALLAEVERAYPMPEDAPAGYPQVIRTGRSVLVTDFDAEVFPALARDARHLALLRALELRSAVMVPLRAHGETLGALTLVLAGPARRTPFDARDLAVAEELARRAGIALDNATRYESERMAAERARRLLAVSAGLSQATTPAQVAAVIFREGMDAVDADAGSLALLRTEPSGAQTFEVVQAGGFAPALVERYRRFPLVPGRPLSDAVLSGTPRLLRSRAEWREAYPEVERETAALAHEALAAVPVLSGGRALAGLTFSFRDPVDFDEGTRTFLATLGEQCGLALERARAFDAEHRAREASAFLAEASRLLSVSLDYEVTLRTVAQAVVPRLGDWCAVDVVQDPAARAWPPRIERLAMVHQDPAKLALAAELVSRWPTDWSAPTGMAAVLRTATSLFIPVVTDEMLVARARDAEHLARLRAVGFSSVIVAPLVARGLTLGALTLCMTESGRHYDADDLALAEDLARRAAVAVDNARLFREAEAARRAAQEANQAKSQFLANMSHELRTPLNAIAGHVELLDMGLRGPVTELQHETLVRVQRAQRHLLGLINDVLDFAKLESGRIDFAVEALPLGEVVAEAASIVEAPLAAKGLTFDVPPADGASLPVWADREKLRQVLLNLLSNAGKFTPPGGRVAISVHEPEQAPEVVHLRVSDTGVGIPPDKLEAIFEPFVQVDAGRTRTAEGTGLGLAISRDLLAGFGGALSAESTPGAGSTFTVTLRRVTTADGRPVDRRTGEARRIEEERRGGDDRRDAAGDQPPAVA